MSKKIVICCDGTWKAAGDQQVTNVVRLLHALKPSDSDGAAQVAYYDAGVGTESRTRRIAGGLFGIGLGTNVREAYRFLANNYEAKDKIYLFGFSRGAFTVRSLAGFIGASGLLKKSELTHVKRAWDYYRTSPDARVPAEKAALQALSVEDPKIHMIGVWDTVGSLGVPFDPLSWMFASRHAFHDAKLGANIDNAYHAVAIDERRGPFKATLWLEDEPRPSQTVEQVWFTGVHSDVGGGYPATESGLSNCAFRWMVVKATAQGLEFDADVVDRHEPKSTDTLHKSRKSFYRLIPQKIRDVDWDGYANGAIHATAWERWTRIGIYRPDNLKRGLAVIPVVDNLGKVVREAGEV